jgi:hypothetical protein
MFIGHYAVALAAKRAAPRPSLGTLFVAAQFVDLLWPIFLLLGMEHVRIAPGNTAFTPLDFYDYPISHSLLTVVGWSAAFAIVYWLLRRDARSSVVLAGCVASHWVLDWVAHRPDMPLAPGVHDYVGLGLWKSVAATVTVELLMLVVGVALFLSASKSKDRIGRNAFWGFIGFVLALYAGNVFGGPPPNVQALAWFGLSQWLVVPWLYWIDRHRVTVNVAEAMAASA